MRGDGFGVHVRTEVLRLVHKKRGFDISCPHYSATFPPDLTVDVDWLRHNRASHSARRGQPAAIHSRNSTVAQSVDLPILLGRGIKPSASQVRQVRSDLLHRAAAILADTNNEF